MILSPWPDWVRLGEVEASNFRSTCQRCAESGRYLTPLGILCGPHALEATIRQPSGTESWIPLLLSHCDAEHEVSIEIDLTGDLDSEPIPHLRLIG